MIYRFGECELDLGLFELRRGCEIEPIEPQVFDAPTPGFRDLVSIGRSDRPFAAVSFDLSRCRGAQG